MKKLLNNNKFNSLKVLVLCFIVTSLLVSCLKSDVEDNSGLYKQQYLKMLNDNNMTSADSIGYEVYMKFDTIYHETDTTRPKSDDIVIFQYYGYDADGKLFGTTDSAAARANGLYRDDLIFGGERIAVKYLVAGLNIALLHMPDSSEATVVMPSDMAFFSGPVKYKLILNKIISDPDSFEIEQLDAYKTRIGFEYDALAIDTTLWYKVTNSGTEFPDLYFNSRVTLKLHAYYCEYLPKLFEKKSGLGRQIFPINSSSDTVSYAFNNFSISSNYPITPAIDSMVTTMKLNESREFITTSDNAYGTAGFIHPYLGNYIVPPFTAIHYKMTLVGVKN